MSPKRRSNTSARVDLRRHRRGRAAPGEAVGVGAANSRSRSCRPCASRRSRAPARRSASVRPMCCAAIWSTEMPFWMSAPAVFRGWTPVRYDAAGPRVVAGAVAERLCRCGAPRPERTSRSFRNGSSGFRMRVNSNAAPGGLRRPVRHDDAVRDVGEAEPHGRFCARAARERGRHRVEHRQRDDGSHALAERAAREVFARDNHGVVLCRSL